MVNQCTLLLLQGSGMTQLHLSHWSKEEKSSAFIEVDPSIAADIWLATKLTVAVRFDDNCALSGTTPVIPKRSNQKRQGRFNRGLYRERNRVERLINRLKQYRRIATRYEKYAVNYLAMLMIGAIRLWL